MKKDKLTIIINIVLLAVYLVSCLVIGFINKFNLNFYYTAISFVIAAGLTNLIFMIIRLSINKDYNFKKYTPAMHSGYVLVAVLAYYLVKNLKHYYKFWYLYWALLIIGSLACVIVFYIMNKKDKTENKPKIIANKR